MRPLKQSDFRASRWILEPQDFALGSDQPERPPSDLVDEPTWRSIISLPDDVAVRTSSHFGTALRRVWGFWNEWNCLVGAVQQFGSGAQNSPLDYVATDTGDGLQASVYNAIVGFYRVAFSCLRNVLENMTIGLQFEMRTDSAGFQRWVNGNKESTFGNAADQLLSLKPIRDLEAGLKKVTTDNLFRQKTRNDAGGMGRRLFRELSKFTHGAPEFTDAGMRNSNGPIFVPEVFDRWYKCFLKTYGLAVLEVKFG